MLSNAYYLAKFCFDIAENEPAKNLQNFKFANSASCSFPRNVHLGEDDGPLAGRQLDEVVAAARGVELRRLLAHREDPAG